MVSRIYHQVMIYVIFFMNMLSNDQTLDGIMIYMLLCSYFLYLLCICGYPTLRPTWEVIQE